MPKPPPQPTNTAPAIGSRWLITWTTYKEGKPTHALDPDRPVTVLAVAAGFAMVRLDRAAYPFVVKCTDLYPLPEPPGALEAPPLRTVIAEELACFLGVRLGPSLVDEITARILNRLEDTACP